MKHSLTVNNQSVRSQQLKRLVFITLGLILVVVVLFAGYYYWDRYVHIGDQSPLELGVAALETAVKENPEDAEARLALAQYYFENGGYAQAVEQAQQVIAAYPENDGALLVLGVSYAMTSRTAEAVAPLQQYAAVRREMPMAGSDRMLETALYFLGESHVRLQQPVEAIAALTEALQIEKTDADAMYQLGLAYAMNDQPELALEQYHNAVRFVPDFSEVYHGMIASYTALNQPEYVAFARGMEAFSLRDYDVARIHLESAINELPYFAPAALGLGLVFEQLDDLPTAEIYLKRAMELDSSSFMTNNALNRVQLALQQNQ